MQYSFPYPVRVRSAVPRIDGLRYSPFTNIDGEAFAKPAMNGYWRLDVNMIAMNKQAHMALSAFHTAMSAAAATCVVPVCVQWRPNDANGRPLTANGPAPEYTFDHVGFIGSPFAGFTLAAAASARDSYVDINTPALSHLGAGHYFTLGDRLHQIVNASALTPTITRASVMPGIRANYDSGTIVVVDQLRLNCRMESGDQIGFGVERFKSSTMSFIEAF